VDVAQRGVTSRRRAGLTVAIVGVLAVVVVAATLILDVPGRITHLAACRTHSATSCPRILFLGNSFTYVNDLPATLSALAQAGGHPIDASSVASGGETLAQHLAAPDTTAALSGSHWEDVIVQEQSQIPSVAAVREQEMYPAARTLIARIRALSASPFFMETWAHRAGWPEQGLSSYESMQAGIDAGYLGIAQELRVPLAPAGDAWLAVTRQRPDIVLWQDDGIHPTVAGTYLAASVLYATLFRQSPVGLSFTDGLPSDVAGFLQAIAGHTVLDDPTRWGLE
jgi:hypothetical protein